MQLTAQIFKVKYQTINGYWRGQRYKSMQVEAPSADMAESFAVGIIGQENVYDVQVVA